MKKLSGWMKRHGSVIMALNAMAIIVASNTVNSACFWVYHQPEVPEEAKKLRKF